MLITALIFVLIILLYLYMDWKAKYWKRKGVNGPNALPLIGNLWDNLFTPFNVLEELRFNKYGNFYGTMMGMKPMLNIGDPEIIKQIMITDIRYFIEMSKNHPDPILAKMISETSGNEWKRLRSILSPTFTRSKLKSMQPSIENCVINTFSYFDKVSEQNLEFDIKEVIIAFTMDVVAKCIFGVQVNALKNPKNEFIVRAIGLLDFKIWRILCRFIIPFHMQYKLDLQLFPNEHVSYFKAHLKSVINERRKTNTNVNDFVSLLLNAESNEKSSEEFELDKKRRTLTEDEIIAQCIIFFIGGYETTTTLLKFTMYALAMNPEVQEMLYQELKDYFQKHKHIDFESLNSLPYFEAVVCESLRNYSPLICVNHICNDDYKLESKNITIEKGTLINLCFYAMHHDPKLFSEPHKYNPERFLPENNANIVPYSFAPFGVGPRTCIGQRFSNIQSKLFLAHLVYNYQLLKSKNTPACPEFDARFITLTCKPLYISLKRRN